VDYQRTGSSLRAVRVHRGRTQRELARDAGVSDSAVSRIERGRLDGVTVGTLQRVSVALDARLDLLVRWRGGDLARLLNRRHSLLHESVARWFAMRRGWAVVPEVSFSEWGERGVIDLLAWHEASATLLVIELKTEIVDVQDLIGGVDRKRRLAPGIAARRGWKPDTVSAWVVVAGSRVNRRRIAAHRTLLRNAFPADGRTVEPWVTAPSGSVAALSMWPDSREVTRMHSGPGRQRVRTRGGDTRVGERAASAGERAASAEAGPARRGHPSVEPAAPRSQGPAKEHGGEPSLGR
jgi:transcriptional regulator with XRE-family HTH domain